MDTTITALALGVSIALFALMIYLDRRRREFGRVRYLPVVTLMFLSAAAALVLIVHLINLAGVETGR